ncbi:hypothetical protein J7399_13905 [Shimia sp. R9_1]|uniref:hypothetical protein n=1 Tax=Shimia sp. R9_1 TaxID=2821111 RepID=UPI001ADA7FB2|nr:hypothetical protein [Shimia sp. R9_1]MBO9408530.1 hypothetical protein [Shimia sp. R9_1]
MIADLILDVTLGLNALVWFAVMLMPLYGAVTGFRRTRPLLKRASLILICLAVLLASLLVTLSTFDTVSDPESLAALYAYSGRLVLALPGVLAMGWGLHFAFSRLRNRA